MPPVTVALESHEFDVAPLLRAAFANATDTQDDVEDYPSDTDTPATKPFEEWNTVDDFDLPPRDASPPPKRPRIDVPTAPDKPPISYSHQKRRRKREQKAKEGQAPQTRTIRTYVHAGEELPTTLDTADLPTAHGAYTAKPADDQEKYGHKKRRSLAELQGLGFRLVRWNG